MSAEVDELVRILENEGALTRNELLARSSARDWRTQSFEGALRNAIAAGSIKELSPGLYQVGDNPPDLNEGRFDPS